MPGALNNSVAAVVQYLLIQLGLGVLPSAGSASQPWPVYRSLEPDQPDNAVTVYSTESVMEGREHVGSQMQSHYGFQVRVRATNDDLAQLKANAVAQALDPLAGYVVTLAPSVGDPSVVPHAYLLASVTRKGDPLSIGNESPTSARKIYTVNAIVAFAQQ